MTEPTITTFEDLNLDKKILSALKDMGFEEPSPIQKGAIPLALEGDDIIGQAQTGTGKTAAFGIPIIQSIDEKNRHVQALVMSPTRELCIQVAEEISKIGRLKRVHVLPVYGGQPIERQIRSRSLLGPRAAFWIICAAAPSVWTISTSSSLMKRMKCLIWGSLKILRPSSRKFRQNGRPCFFQRRCPVQS